MIYEFRDVNETSEGVVLPSEALQINGEYIENLIKGYRTLNVSGREALSPDVESFATGYSDGSRLKSKRYPERIIIVTYQLIAESNEAFREAYNQLGKILNVKDAQLIFNDEQDKYFTGTPCIIGEIEPGKNSVIGEFEILCTDPFKYSVMEYEATADLDDSSIMVDYNGTYKAYPILEADFHGEEDVEVDDDGVETENALTGAGDCGFVAFFTEDEKIVQLGDPGEVDGEEVPKSQTLFNQTFKASSSYGSSVKKQWVANTVAGVPAATFTPAGSLAMAVSSYEGKNVSGTTTKTLIDDDASTAGRPVIYYTVKVKTHDRKANSVKITVTITTRLRSDVSYFGNGYILQGKVYMPNSGGIDNWHHVILKNSNEKWAARTAHTSSVTFTVTGLTETITTLAGFKFEVTRPDNKGTAGIYKSSENYASLPIPVSSYSVATANGYYLSTFSYGSGSNYHGPSITRTIPADVVGEVGAANFTLTYEQQMHIGTSNYEGVGTNDTKMLGLFNAQATAADGTVVAGVTILKNKTGKTASLLFYVNGKKVYTGSVDLSRNNKYFGETEAAAKTSKITKSGSKVTFNTAGVTKSFVDEDIADTKVTKVSFAFGQYGSKPAIIYNGIYWAKFVKNNCNTFKNVPNKFSANDVVEADCRNAEIRLNGILSPELGALGNDWEAFVLTPGLNQIGFAYSDWIEADYAPEVKVRYREVFL